MSKVYDNWERVVEATLKRDNLRQIARAPSLSSSTSDDSSQESMSKVYDNWEKLVDATLKRENLRQITLARSFSSCISDDYSEFYSFRSDWPEGFVGIHLFEDEIRKAIEATLKRENLSQIDGNHRFSSSTSDYSKGLARIHLFEDEIRKAIEENLSEIVLDPDFSSSASDYSKRIEALTEGIEALTVRILLLADEFRKASGTDSMHPFDMEYLPLLSRALTQLYERQKNKSRYHRGFPQNFTFIVKLYRRFSLGSWDP